MAREMARLPILQEGSIPVAHEIKGPLTLGKAKLDLWLDFSREVVGMQGFQSVAFTQFAPMVREYLGFSEYLQPRVMFYRTDMESDGQLIINPKVSLPKLGNRMVAVLERCGSILHGQVSYIINRPYLKKLEGFFYDGQVLKRSSLFSDFPYDEYSIHEIDHLDGKTAKDRPTDFFDIRKKKHVEQVYKSYSQYTKSEVNEMIRNASPEGMLVYNKSKKMFEIISRRELEVELALGF